MQLISTHPVKKSDLGFHGNLFGGKILSWIDSSAAAYAMEYCRNRKMVTIMIDKCVFKRPAKEGSLVKIYADVSNIGNTSIELYVEAKAINVYTKEETLILSTSIKFVRIDEDGFPIPIYQDIKDEFLKNKKTK